MAPRLWLLEGLPGTGKTTAAGRLAEMCIGAGLPARWWPEEAKDHPATPAALRMQAAQPDFPELCTAGFRALLQRRGLLILEGAAFQSTIRFMFAENRPAGSIAAYVADWAYAVAPAQPRLIVFRVDDVRAHFDQVVAIRGQAWISKLVAYMERTPVAAARGWRGFEGFLAFWAAYQRLILDMAAVAGCPVLMLPGWPEGRKFAADEAFAFLCDGVRPVRRDMQLPAVRVA